MDRAALAEMLDEGLSLAEIARRSSLHESTVGYWVKKHGLRAVNRDRHSERGGLAADDLRQLVDSGLSISEIADAVALSRTSVRHWLGKHGLRTRPAARRDRRRAARNGRLSTVQDVCRRHGKASFYLDHEGYCRCKKCRTEAVMRRRRRVKRTLVAEAGGCCRLCGYERYFGALQFHHVDPASKSFGLSIRGLTPSIAKLRLEARKCILLCSNCHAEVEGGMRSISGIARSGDPG
jgi:transposase